MIVYILLFGSRGNLHPDKKYVLNP